MNQATVDLWTVDLDSAVHHDDARLRELLSGDERERADRLLRGRRWWTVSRAALRTILAKYVDTPAAALRFVYGTNGKPELEPSLAGGLHFNLSHSDHLALLAVTRHGPLGVDIEQVRDRRYMAKIITRFFAPAEQRCWLQLPRDQQVAGFFNCWTRKEAYIKAIGTGLQTPLDSFNVSLTPGQPARLLAVDGVPDVSHWCMQHLEVPSGFAGALAIEGPGGVTLVPRVLG